MGEEVVVHTSAGQYWKKLQLWLQKKGEAVFTEKEARQALFWLKKVNKKLEMRSLRRGALQELSGHATRDIVMSFSGHTNERQLLRYLEYGRKDKSLHQKGEAAASALW